MHPLIVRKLLIDLSQPFARRWNGGDAFRSAFFNALSMSFPMGEQYFMDSVRAGLQTLPSEQQERWKAEIQGFVGQEATHRRIHSLFNAELERQGFVNALEVRVARRIRHNAGRNVRMHVAATAATEHITAMFADWMLSHPEALAGAEPRLQTLWLWHSAEESEHRSTAFDLYRAIGGEEQWRIRVFRYVTFTFLVDIGLQTVRNLWHDKALFRWSTWSSGWQLLFSVQGLLRSNYRAWRNYERPQFHPSQQGDTLARAWLQDNQHQWRVVGATASAPVTPT